MSNESQERLVLAALRVALRPLVALALRHSFKLMDFMELLKAVYLDVAERELRRNGKEPNVSKLSVMTGVHRRDATRLFRDKSDLHLPGDLVTRVIGQWKHSARFQSASGRPRSLSFEGVESDFCLLVRSVSADVAPYTVLHELERRKLIRKSRSRVALRKARFIAATGDWRAGFEMIGEDVRDLISAAEENISGRTPKKNLHLKTEFDNVPASAEAEVRAWLLAEGCRIHERVESYLAKHDRDAKPKKSRPGKRLRVAFGSFSFVESE